MKVVCPHCKAVHNITRDELYRYAKCKYCGKGFVMGASTNQTKTEGTTTGGPRKGSESESDGAIAKTFEEFSKNLHTTSYDGASDIHDIKFTIRGWLYIVYWVANIIGTIFLFILLSQAVENGLAMLFIILAWPSLLLVNRLWYEISIAIFEAVKHLRQIRDALRKLSVNAEPESHNSTKWDNKVGVLL